jgi:hypothetical protein
VLCGSEPDAALDVTYAGVIEVLATAVRSGDTVIVAAGDLAHVGPAFGDPPLDRLALVRLEADDRVALERLAAGDAEGFVGAARDGRDARYCGLAPIYLAMRATGARASDIRYAQCPADGAGTSVVSVASALLRQVD